MEGLLACSVAFFKHGVSLSKDAFEKSEGEVGSGTREEAVQRSATNFVASKKKFRA